MQRRFASWVSNSKKNDQFSFRMLTRGDIAEFIDALKIEGITLQTIQKGYLAALNGLFELAQTAGEYPAGELPTRNHKIFTRRDKKKAASNSGWKPFTDEELSLIFYPDNILDRVKPCDYWLPILGLYTGGRLGELCQLTPKDIKQIDGIWAVDINNEDNKSVKTEAGIRKIPLHPKLIELGFLEYLEDVSPYGGTIFPYLTPDRFRHYDKAPSRRFGEYLDLLGITDDRKVFHSFRSTSNNKLKQNGVEEESRCQFIGHVHDTVNSKVYSTEHTLRYLLDNVAVKLKFDHIDFSKIVYPREQMKVKLIHLMKLADRKRAHKAAGSSRKENSK